jgi:tetratricopeptide (TPR) repeat protein
MYLSNAQKAEARGDKIEALKQYKLVLTVNPDHQLANDKSIRIIQDLKILAENHYQEGLRYFQNGQYNAARNEFLCALRYDPEHDRSKKILMNQENLMHIDSYVLHTIQPNEKLSSLAQIYYGDYRMVQPIIFYNKLEDSTDVKVGQHIKVPVIEGIPIIVDTSKIHTDPSEILITNEIIELQEALDINPNDAIAKRNISLAYFHKGYEFFQTEEYSRAVKAFKKSLAYDNTCKECEHYIKLSEENFKEFHYNKGIVFFNQERLIDAIEEWKLVYNLDPNFKDVLINIEKAQLLMSRLEKIKMSMASKSYGYTSREEKAAGFRETGIELLDKGEITGAIYELNKALAINPNDETAKQNLSKAYFEKELSQYPKFPWPPPKASATIVIPDNLIRKSSDKLISLYDVNKKIVTSLNDCGYAEKSYFVIQDGAGFAIVTRLEQINSDGSPKNNQIRWITKVKPMSNFSLSGYIEALFKGKIGYYRVFTFLVTDLPILQSGDDITREGIESLRSAGSNKLPCFTQNKSYSEQHRCTVLIYEFEKKESDSEVRIRIPGEISAKSHLKKSNIWIALEES